ncbi:predicted protein [Histoplasma mississippiense (nom. inval.)]|nr:predicted protein [Histoplasma mississippiense (nom. inval.)]EDN05558.1 predicted protein [Histoplasma mississippiense (nom. inval.)]
MTCSILMFDLRFFLMLERLRFRKSVFATLNVQHG